MKVWSSLTLLGAYKSNRCAITVKDVGVAASKS